MIEPFYVRQSPEFTKNEEARKFADECVREGRARGAGHARLSQHPEKGVLLFEAWDVSQSQVAEAGGEGDPRWMLLDTLQ